MTTLANPRGGTYARDQLQQWGVLLLIVLLLLGLILFIVLVLEPDMRRRSEYDGLLTSAETELVVAQQAKAEAPARVQARLVAAEQKLNEASQIFLNEAESSVVVNRLYTYAQAADVEIVNLRAAPVITTDAHSQRDFQFQVAGSLDSLLDFLGRIEEVNLSGFLVNRVALEPDQERHLLNMTVSAYTSRYSTRSVLAPDFESVAAMPLAEVQQQMEQAWVERDWNRVIHLLEQVVTATPENEAARIALYRAHVNYGYLFLADRNYAAAKAQFEAALIIQPDGREALVELQQMEEDNTLSHSVEDRLRQEAEQASAGGNWREAIRLLRIIGAVDSTYDPVEEELNQAYISYGDQLVMQGDSVTAEEQYQLANYSRPDQDVPADTMPLTAAAALSLTATITPQMIAEAIDTPVPTSTPTPSPSPTETATPSPTPSSTASPAPTSTPTSTATQPPTATATPTSTPVVAASTATAIPTATDPVAMPTAGATHIVQQGDTLYSIASRYGTSVEALRAANGLGNDNIRVGQVLFLTASAPQPPSPGTLVHTVANDDTLYSLARRYGTTVEAIMQANGLNNNRIYVGQRLTIPGTAAAIAQVVEPTVTSMQPTNPSFTCPSGCSQQPDPSCSIKGNFDGNNGDKIYHVVGGRYYEGTDVNPEEGDVWFCTEEEAINAGYRAPLN